MKKYQALSVLAAGVLLMSAQGFTHVEESNDGRRFIQVRAKTVQERSKIAGLGMAIDAVLSDGVWGSADPKSLSAIKKEGFEIVGDFPIETARGGHGSISTFDYNSGDQRFRNYDEMTSELELLASQNADIAKVHDLGTSREGRHLVAIQINSSGPDLLNGSSNKPGIFFEGMHHAREHLAAQITMMIAKYILENRNDPQIEALIDSRDIWVAPMMNPDGLEHDIDGGQYKYWRKNRTQNSNGTYGVDLNRNYGYKWGSSGGQAASPNPSSDTYRGPTPFSEPETQAIKNFVDARPNLNAVISIHTFSELILYPWGWTNDPISNQDDFQLHKKVAETMARWNGYTPEQTSDLYIAPGTTMDWAYGEHGIMAFTFELSPKMPSNPFGGAKGFYAGAPLIDQVFTANIRPFLYLVDLADNPKRALAEKDTPKCLDGIVHPKVPLEFFWESEPWRMVQPAVANN